MNFITNFKLKIFFILIFFIFFLKNYVEINIIKIPFTHDTLATFEVFSFNYKYYKEFIKFPLWLDYVDYGAPSLFTNHFYYPAYFNVIIVFFSKLNLQPSTLFNIGLSFTNLIFIFGIYLNFKNNSKKFNIILFLTVVYIFIIDFSFIVHSFTFWFLIFPYCTYYFKEFFDKKKFSKLLNFIILYLLYFFIYNTYYQFASLYIFIILFLFFYIFYVKNQKTFFLKINFQQSDILRFFIIISLSIIVITYFDHIFKNYYFSSSGDRSVDGVTFQNLINYANYPLTIKIKRFIELGIFQNDYGFQLPLSFGLLTFYYFISNKESIKSHSIIYLSIIIILFLISNPISFILGEKILYLFYNYLPYFKQFRHSGYLFNLTIPFVLILMGIYTQYFLRNIKILKIKYLNIFKIIVIIFSFFTLFIYFKFNNFFIFFLNQLISLLIIFCAFNIYNYKNSKYAEKIFLCFIILSLIPNYFYSISNSFKDKNQFLLNKINNYQINFPVKCVLKNEIDKEYESFEYPGITSSYFFLHSDQKPCYPYYKTSIYGSQKKYTSKVSTKGQSEKYFTTSEDLKNTLIFFKKFLDLNKNVYDGIITGSASTFFNIEPSTVYYRVLILGKLINSSKIDNLKWPNNYYESLFEIADYNPDDDLFLNYSDKINLNPVIFMAKGPVVIDSINENDQNLAQNLYTAKNIYVEKIDNERLYFQNNKNENQIGTFISFSKNWGFYDKDHLLVNNKIENVNGYLYLNKIKNYKEFYLKYNDNEAFLYLYLTLFFSTIIFIILINNIFKIKN